MTRKKNYAMVKLNVPKRVELLLQRYKRIKRSESPPHIVMRIPKELLLEVDVEE